MFHVQHRHGNGRPHRSAAIARSLADTGVQIGVTTEGFDDVLAGTLVSVSQAGDNAVSELLASGAPAAAMVRRGLARVGSTHDASPASPALAMAAALGAGRMRHDIHLAGVSRSVHRVSQGLE